VRKKKKMDSLGEKKSSTGVYRDLRLSSINLVLNGDGEK
jgi:hypothetical protein